MPPQATTRRTDRPRVQERRRAPRARYSSADRCQHRPRETDSEMATALECVTGHAIREDIPGNHTQRPGQRIAFEHAQIAVEGPGLGGHPVDQIDVGRTPVARAAAEREAHKDTARRAQRSARIGGWPRRSSMASWNTLIG